MITDAEIKSQLKYVLSSTHFDFLEDRYEGKVRDCYTSGGERILITTDRLSCFDVVVTTIPFKGQVLNELAVHWFNLSSSIVKNHIIDVPDPNVMVVRSCEILPVEVIVRGYLTGSAWRDYEAGKKISGVQLQPGLRANQRLPEVIMTPSTKAPKGDHDLPISEQEIVSSGLVDKKLWEKVREAAFALFDMGQREAERHGLILVDTKYEFGLANGELLLADEIHTLDSSRYWQLKSYNERFERGENPDMLDKEPTRQWLLSKGYKGDGLIPEFTDDHRVSISRHYVDSFEKISGKPFSAQVGSVQDRIDRALRSCRTLKKCAQFA